MINVGRDTDGDYIVRMDERDAALLYAIVLRGVRWGDKCAIGDVARAVALGLDRLHVRPADWAPVGWVSGKESPTVWVDASALAGDASEPSR